MTIKIENVRLTYPHLQSEITGAVFAAYIKMPLKDTVWIVAGYDPQKLLPSPETARPLTMREWCDVFARDIINEVFENRFSFLSRIPTLFPGDALKFSDIYPSADDVIPIMEKRTPTFRHTETVVVFGTGSKDFLANLPATQRFAAIDVQRWNDPDATPLEDLKRAIDEIYNSRTQIDVHVELGLLYDAPDPLYKIHYPRMEYEPEDAEMVETSAGKRNMSYLKHDRTKSHKRRRK